MSQPASLPAPRYRHVFIVTYGRSGSTLLQGVLNALPGYLIRGENYDAIRHLELLFNRLARAEPHRPPDTPAGAEPVRGTTDPFFGFEAFNDQDIASAIRLLLEHLLLRGVDRSTVRCTGFKEIRFTPQNLVKKVDFLRRIFPGCAVLYNIREPAAVVQSEFQKDKEVSYFEEFNALLEARSKAEPNAFLVRYEDVVRCDGTLIGLHDFLGEPFDRARMQQVLAVKHSYHTAADGQFFSNFPRFVQVSKTLRELSLLVIDRFEPLPDRVRLGGLILARDSATPARFSHALDEQGRRLNLKATFEMASPSLGKRVGNEAANNARFELSFPRAGSEEHRLFLGEGEPAVTVRSEAPVPP